MNTRRLYLVSCVKEKQSRPAAARELYRSAWFGKARAYVERQGGPWLILSAKYGAVPPQQRLRPYDVTLNRMGAARRREWAKQVSGQLRRRCRRGDEVIILAGERYREYLVPAIRTWGCRVRVPMRHLGIGGQLRWLNRALGERHQ